jgi:hypothetical protein
MSASPSAAALLLLSAAFWTALALAARRESDPRLLGRLAAGLAAGALAAHLGWALLHAHALAERPALLLSPGGFCVLFVPLGLIAAAPGRGAERERYLAAAFASLPLALAVARLGCLASGCCGGAPVRGASFEHPAALYEVAGLAALHAVARGSPPARVAPLVLGGLGALRLAVGPFRAPPAEAPLVPVWLVAASLGAAGAALHAASWSSSARAARNKASGSRSGTRA